MSEPTAVFADFAEQIAWLIQQALPATRIETEDDEVLKVVESEKQS